MTVIINETSELNNIKDQNKELDKIIQSLDGANTKQDRMANHFTNQVNYYKNINFALLITYFVIVSIYSNFIFFNTYYEGDSRINIFLQTLLTILVFLYPYVIMYIEKRIFDIYKTIIS